MVSQTNDIVKQASLSYVIDASWIRAIIAQESSWNQYAIRYEPTYTYLYKPSDFSKKLNISLATETVCQELSWGLGQIMGAVARQQGHDGPMGELFQPETNIKHICLTLHHLKNLSPNIDDIFAMYNGGPSAIHLVNSKYKNQAYVDSIKKHLQTYMDG